MSRLLDTLARIEQAISIEAAEYVPAIADVFTIIDQARGKKVIIYKFKRRKMYRRRNGHRQDYTQVKIDGINV